MLQKEKVGFDKKLVARQLSRAVHQRRAASVEGLLERGFSKMFQGLVYAQIWEDPVADMAALQIRPGEDLVCIASGGCNMMSYLTADPGSITAVDLSPAHVALGRLKLEAAQRLDDHAEFGRLFCGRREKRNVETWGKLAPHLDPMTRSWWSKRTATGPRHKMLSRGLHRYGALGRFFAALRLLARARRVRLDEIARCGSLEAQRWFFETKLQPLFDEKLIRFLAKRRVSLFGLGIPPAQYEKLAADQGGDILPVLLERTRRLACDFPIHQNYFAWSAFVGGYDPAPNGSRPPYLEKDQFDAVKSAAPRAALHNRSLTELLAETPEGSRDVYVLLDAQDWMNDAQLGALWREIDRTARPGARVLFRTGGAPDILPNRAPADVMKKWERDAAASAIGFERDRSSIYGAAHLYRKTAA